MQIRKKLKSRRGETLSEVLVAVLVGALAIAMLTIMVSVSVRIIQRNRSALNEYYKGNNNLMQYQEGSNVTEHLYNSAGAEDRMTVTLQNVFGEGQNAEDVHVDYYVHLFNGKEIVVYHK